jgi:hypothetical protein
MTAPMGSHMSQHGSPIGNPNCVEVHVPANLDRMLGGVMGASPMGMAFGGGRYYVI